jgi:hypothetical protein
VPAHCLSTAPTFVSTQEEYSGHRFRPTWKKTAPEDLETSDRYITVPHKNNLGLGRNLALAIVSQELPNDYDTVAGFFRRKGAYGRFKKLLASRGMLEAWYTFEENETMTALRGWCEENSIQLVDA